VNVVKKSLDLAVDHCEQAEEWGFSVWISENKQCPLARYWQKIDIYKYFEKKNLQEAFNLVISSDRPYQITDLGAVFRHTGSGKCFG
jgi:hypothetical protein